MTINQTHLKHVEQRIQSNIRELQGVLDKLKSDPDNSDIYYKLIAGHDDENIRLSFAKTDVLSRMSQEEVDEYEQSKVYVPTEDELRRQRDDDRRTMNENKDRPSV